MQVAAGRPVGSSHISDATIQLHGSPRRGETVQIDEKPFTVEMRNQPIHPLADELVT